MPKPSELIAKLEKWVAGKAGDKLKKKHIPLIVLGWYFYGMLVNSIRRGIDSVFGSEPVTSIWVANPLKNFIAVFTPTGLIVTAVGFLLVCLF